MSDNLPKLQLDDHEVKYLIELMKKIKDQIDKIVTIADTGELFISSLGGKHHFILNYHFSEAQQVLNFREESTNISIIRINLNQSFHRNADGTKIHGPRINVFSEQEYYDKADGHTYMRAFPLPYHNINPSNNIIQLLEETLQYLNVTLENYTLAHQQKFDI